MATAVTVMSSASAVRMVVQAVVSAEISGSPVWPSTAGMPGNVTDVKWSAIVDGIDALSAVQSIASARCVDRRVRRRACAPKVVPGGKRACAAASCAVGSVNIEVMLVVVPDCVADGALVGAGARPVLRLAMVASSRSIAFLTACAQLAWLLEPWLDSHALMATFPTDDTCTWA